MAAVKATVTVRGLAELEAMLRRLPAEVEGPIMRAALTASGTVIQRAAQKNIRRRTGRTAADIRLEVQVQPGQQEGVAAVGGTRKKGGRAYVLRFLEFGTKAHKIVAGKAAKAEARKQVTRLRQLGPAVFARALVRAQQLGVKPKKFARALKLPGGAFRAVAQHPGIRPQAPLTRALAEQGPQALKVFAATIWQGIVQVSRREKNAA